MFGAGIKGMTISQSPVTTLDNWINREAESEWTANDSDVVQVGEEVSLERWITDEIVIKPRKSE